MTSPYQSRAADFDQNGMVSLADAIGVLRHSVGLPTDQVPKWIFFNEADGDLPKQPILSPGTAIPVRIDTSPSITTGLVGVLRGDVDGSWEPPATLHRLLDDRPEHLNDLVARFLIDPDLPDISLAQWGIYPP